MKRIVIALALSVLYVALITGCAGVAIQHMDDESRDRWQKPDAVIGLLGIPAGGRVADLGAGGGYFTRYLAQAVGARGTVFAVDIDARALELAAADAKRHGLTNVVAIVATPDDPRLPEPVDLVFSSDAYHHMSERVAYFERLTRALKPGGRVAILDFHARGVFSGWLGHGTDKLVVRSEMAAAGYRLLADYDVNDRQHLQLFTRIESTH